MLMPRSQVITWKLKDCASKITSLMNNYLYLMQIHISQIVYDQMSWPLPAGHGGVHCLTGGSIRKDPEIGIHKKIS